MSADSSSSPWYVRVSRAEHRKQLIHVAHQLFETRGYDTVSVKEIASTAGVSRPIVYEHFGGREGLYQIIVDREVRVLSNTLRSQIRPEHNARAVSERIVVTLLDFIKGSADGFHLLTHQSPTTVRNETLETVMANIVGRATILLAPLPEKQGPDPASALVYKRILAGGVRQIGQRWNENMQVDKKLVAAQVTNLLYLGLRGMEKDPQLQTR